MNLRINDENRESGAKDITGLLEELGIHPKSVLVEHNGTALRREEWESTSIHDGDRLEIIRVVAGG